MYWPVKPPTMPTASNPDSGPGNAFCATLNRKESHTMSEIVENMILEHLKRFQAGQDRIETKLDELVMRVGQLEGAVLGIKREIVNSEESGVSVSLRVDTLSKRLDRIEKRLELTN
jgi:tetrahydromethanopterin S-methyltransferase subunit G